MRYSTTGTNNAALGVYSLTNNSIGISNTALGNEALRFNTTGGSSTAVGVYSLRNNTTGIFNTAIGIDSGRYIGNGGANSTANRSLFLGGFTKALNNGETNQIVIGHSALGNGSNSVTLGNDSITLTVLKGVVKMTGLPSSPIGLDVGSLYTTTGGALKIVL